MKKFLAFVVDAGSNRIQAVAQSGCNVYAVLQCELVGGTRKDISDDQFE